MSAVAEFTELARLADADPACPASPPGVILIGASTGGPGILANLLRNIDPATRWPIVIAQHMPDTFTDSLARRLNTLCPLPVREVHTRLPLVGGQVYIARGGHDITMRRAGGGVWLHSEDAAARYLWHPSVDHLVESAMGLFDAQRLVGILLSGMGNDGAATMAELKKEGGRTVAESKDSAVVFGMPKELIERGGASEVRCANDIPQLLQRWLG